MTFNKDKALIIFGALSALAGIAAFFTYIESRKSRSTKEEIMNLDKQIKSLQLKKLKG